MKGRASSRGESEAKAKATVRVTVQVKVKGGREGGRASMGARAGGLRICYIAPGAAGTHQRANTFLERLASIASPGPAADVSALTERGRKGERTF